MKPAITITRIGSTSEALGIIERMTGMSEFEATRCEWDPDRDEPSAIGGGCRNEAAVSVGSRTSIHLCASCAALPAFARYRKRRPL